MRSLACGLHEIGRDVIILLAKSVRPALELRCLLLDHRRFRLSGHRGSGARHGCFALRPKLGDRIIVGADLFLNGAIVRRTDRFGNGLAQRLQLLLGRDDVRVRVRIDRPRRSQGRFGFRDLLIATRRLLAVDEQLPVLALKRENLCTVRAGIDHRAAAHRQGTAIAGLKIRDLALDLLNLA